ncbi:MATE family efflux transporter [Sunxiuqinia rutila]|uniref:MATE family efflux transporter n=1 Tax=Sunxiuqinia rutila TaxID=1397841 RepID=UPI003D3677BC
MKRIWRLYRPHYAETRRLALPVIVAQIGQITVGLADNMMIGRLGKTELAAAAFANTLFSLPLIFGMGFAMAITPLTGKANGSNDYAELLSLKKAAFAANSIMAVLLAMACLLLYSAMPFMHQPESILDYSRHYFSVIGLSIVPLMLFLSGKQFADGLSNTKLAMMITLGANVVNILGNYMLIFGKWGAPELGLVGAGWSTLIARVLMAVGMLIFVRKLYREQLQSVVANVKSVTASTLKIIKLGIPMGLHMFSESSAFIVAGIMMGWISETGLAAHQIVISLSTFGFMLYQGIGVSTTIRISQLAGRQVPSLLKRASNASIQIVLGMVVIISMSFVSLSNWLPTLFTTDAEVIRLASQMIIVLAIFQLFDAIQIIYSGILRGMADATIPGILTFICYFIITIPFSYWAAFHGGFNEIGIWMGFPVGLSICALMFHFRLSYLHRKLNLEMQAS